MSRYDVRLALCPMLAMIVKLTRDLKYWYIVIENSSHIEEYKSNMFVIIILKGTAIDRGGLTRGGVSTEGILPEWGYLTMFRKPTDPAGPAICQEKLQKGRFIHFARIYYRPTGYLSPSFILILTWFIFKSRSSAAPPPRLVPSSFTFQSVISSIVS